MGVYLRGNGLTIVQRFYTVDAVTEDATLANPTTVEFQIEDPDGNVTSKVFGVDTDVTNPSTGLFLCVLPSPLPTGDYSYVVVGTGAVAATGVGSFTIGASGVLAGDPATSPEYGPCTPWITGEDVLNALNSDGDEIADSDVFKLENAAAIGGATMWELSGRQMDGICDRTVRPCKDTCGCFGGVGGIIGLGPWSWGWGYGGAFGYAGNYWFNECGDRCGCGTLSSVTLTGNPVRKILEVKIDGEVQDLDHFRLDYRRHLVYKADPGPPVVPRRWPACQNMALDDDQPGTFSIRYTHGVPPTPLGKLAAAQLGGEIYKASLNLDCKLPQRATRVIRQGVTIEQVASFAQQWRIGASGLTFVDLFLAASNPTGMRRAPYVVQLDRRGPARRLGQ